MDNQIEQRDPELSKLLSGKRVWVTAERRVDNQRRYLELRGAEVVSAPLMKTIDNSSNDECTTVAQDLIANPPAVLIIQTGQGLKWWTDRLEPEVKTQFLDAMANVLVWSRGAKSTSRCRSLGLRVDWESSSESAVEIAEHCSILPENTRVAVQLVGTVDDVVVDALEALNADTVGMPVYRYALPVDQDRCHDLISEAVAGQIDAITFTASPAIQHLLSIAESIEQREDLDSALNSHCVPVVVGPVCAATASDAGWNNVVEPERARLIPMLDALTEALANQS